MSELTQAQVSALNKIAMADMEDRETLKMDLHAYETAMGLESAYIINERAMRAALDKEQRIRDAAPELLEALELFERCAYPVCKTINPRGHNWMPEERLDYALTEARRAIARAKGGE